MLFYFALITLFLSRVVSQFVGSGAKNTVWRTNNSKSSNNAIDRYGFSSTIANASELNYKWRPYIDVISVTAADNEAYFNSKPLLHPTL